MDLSNYNIRRSTARTSTESLIEDIVNETTEKDKKKLSKLLAITARTLKWSEQDLHRLYQKRLDPNVRNYTALVWWHTKIRNHETNDH